MVKFVIMCYNLSVTKEKVEITTTFSFGLIIDYKE